MNMPQGYKHTELGIVPEDWNIVTIGQIANIVTGNKNTQDAEDGGKYPFYVRSQNIERINTFSYDTEGVITAGDGVGTGKIFHYAVGKFGLHQRAYLIHEFKKIDCKFFYWYFSQNFYDRINQMTAKSSVDSVRKEMIEDMHIPLPPLSEQKAIAQALTDVDNLIAALDKQISKKRLLKQGAMQQLLTGKKRLPGFSGEWVEKKLGDVGYTYSGLTGKTKKDFGNGNAKYVTFLNVLSNPILKEELFEAVTVSEADCQNKVQYGDLFFNTSSETPEDVGTCAVLLSQQTNLYLNSFCFGYRLIDNNILGLYLAYYFRSNIGRQLMIALAQGATRYNLSKELFNSSYIILPKTFEEQQAIVTILNDMDTEISNLETKREKYRLIKQGMMQKLLTGQIRLKN